MLQMPVFDAEEGQNRISTPIITAVSTNGWNISPRIRDRIGTAMEKAK